MIVELSKECFASILKVTRHNLSFTDPELFNMGVIRAFEMLGISYPATRAQSWELRRNHYENPQISK